MNNELVKTFLEDLFQTIVNLREDFNNLEYWDTQSCSLYDDQEVWDILNKHTSKMNYIIRLLERATDDED